MFRTLNTTGSQACPGRIFFCFTISTFLCHVVSAAEPTVAEKDDRRTVAQIKKNFEETLKATPTKVEGRALLPDGTPAAGFKIGGWGRSLTHIGYGHFLFDTVTDKDGRFSLALYRPCQYWISIDDPNDVHVAPDRYLELKDAFDGELLFRLRKGVRVEGVVMDGEKKEPIAGLSVFLCLEPIDIEKIGRKKYREIEPTRQVPKERKTDALGRFRFAALPFGQMVAVDRLFGEYPPKDGELSSLYTRTFTVQDQPIRLRFDIPTPWSGRLVQKDGTPAAFYPVRASMRLSDGTAYEDPITDRDGRFTFYRPIELIDLSVDTFDENQWFYRNFRNEKLPADPEFRLYSPLTAAGRLVRKSTGEPMRNFKFLCMPSKFESVTTDEEGRFEIKGIYLDRKTSLCFPNPPDDDSCSIQTSFKTWTPTMPDEKIELGTIELEESGRLDAGTLENLPGKVIKIEGVTPDGRAFDWKQYQGKVVLVEFWATWCGPCIKEIPHLKEVYDQYHDRGFEIVGINVDEDLKALKKGLDKYEFPWTVLSDQKRADDGKLRMYDLFAIRGVPRGILVDRDGKVVTIETRGERLDAELKKLFPDSLDEAETYGEIRSYIEHVFAQTRKNMDTIEDRERFLEVYPPVGIAGGRKIIALEGDEESLEEGYGVLMAALNWSLAKRPENVGEIESLMKELEKIDKFPDLVSNGKFYLFYHRLRLFEEDEFSKDVFDSLKEEAKNLVAGVTGQFSYLGPIQRILEVAGKNPDSRLIDDTLEEWVSFLRSVKPDSIEKDENFLRGFRRRIVGSPFELWGKTLDGNDFSWSDLAGKVVLVDFTASWCGPCRQEMPNVIEMDKRYRDQGLVVVCVGFQDKTENLKKMVKEDDISFIMISEELSNEDPRGLPSGHYGIRGIPSILLVDRDGRIVATNLRGPFLREAVEKQFAE